MPLPFRQRIFVILVALTAVPTALAVVGWALAVRTVAPSAGGRSSPPMKFWKVSIMEAQSLRCESARNYETRLPPRHRVTEKRSAPRGERGHGDASWREV